MEPVIYLVNHAKIEVFATVVFSRTYKLASFFFVNLLQKNNGSNSGFALSAKMLCVSKFFVGCEKPSAPHKYRY